MADSDGGGKVLGIDRKQGTIIVIAAGGAFAIVWWLKHRKGAASSSTSTTVITGSSSTGIDSALLNAILKDWQQSEDGGGGSGGSGGGSTTTSTGGGKKPKKTTTTSTGGGKKPKKPGTGGGHGTTSGVGNKPTQGGSYGGGGKGQVSYTDYTVRRGDTIASLARRFGITPAQLAHSNVYVPGEVPGNAKVGQTLGTGAGLKTGQVLRIPHYSLGGRRALTPGVPVAMGRRRAAAGAAGARCL